MTNIKDKLISPTGIITVSSILLVLATIESFLVPWSPYFFVFAVIASIIPLYPGTIRFGKFKKVFSSKLLFIIIFWIVMIIWDQLTSGSIEKKILSALNIAGDPYYSLPAFIDAILNKITIKMNISLMIAQLLFAFIAVIWAPIGEEFFYRGYIFGGLRDKYGFVISSVISSFFFSVRHMLPVLFLLPDFYWIPALNWGLLTFVYGMMSSLLYEKTGSLYPCMIGHALVNVFGVLVM